MARRASFSFFLVCLNKLLKTCLSNKPAVLLWEFVLQIFFLFSGSWNQQKPFRNYHWVAVLCFCSFSLVHGFMDFFTLCTWFVFVPDVYFPYTQVTHFFFLIYFYYLSKKETTSRESSSFTSQVFFFFFFFSFNKSLCYTALFWWNFSRVSAFTFSQDLLSFIEVLPSIYWAWAGRGLYEIKPIRLCLSNFDCLWWVSHPLGLHFLIN